MKRQLLGVAWGMGSVGPQQKPVAFMLEAPVAACPYYGAPWVLVDDMGRTVHCTLLRRADDEAANWQLCVCPALVGSICKVHNTSL